MLFGKLGFESATLLWPQPSVLWSGSNTFNLEPTRSSIVAQFYFRSGSRVMWSFFYTGIFKKREKFPLRKNFHLKKEKKIMTPEHIFFSWHSEWWIFVLNLTPYTFCLLSYSHFRIQFRTGSTSLQPSVSTSVLYLAQNTRTVCKKSPTPLHTCCPCRESPQSPPCGCRPSPWSSSGTCTWSPWSPEQQ